MVIKRPLAIVCLSIACGKGSDFSFYDAGNTSDDASYSSSPIKPACSDSGFTIDGLFTGFTPSNDPKATSLAPFEWGGVMPVRGKYT